jgi:threonine-phosphate decarboxylase
MCDPVGEKGVDPDWDHGGPPPGEAGLPRIDASTTVNPFPSSDLAGILKKAIARARVYPDPVSGDARSSLGLKFSLDPERIVTGGGATVLLYALIRDASVRRLILFEPVFSEYERAARMAGIPVCRIPPDKVLPYSGDQDGGLSPCRWGIDPESVSGISIVSGDLAVLVNPVNPTGQEFSSERVLKLAMALSERGGSLLVDESFQDFIDNRSSVLSAAGERGISVLRSLTKISGFPGLRTGYLAGEIGCVARIRQALGPWNTGTLEQELMIWASRRRDSSDFGWKEEAKDALHAVLRRAGIPYVPGAGPFVFIRPGWGSPEGKSAKERLWRQGIRIRLGNGFGPEEGEQFIRLGFEAFLKGEALVAALRTTG